MKKNVLILAVLVFLPVTMAFADGFSLSAGGGGLLGYTFTRYTMEGNGLTSTQTMDRFNYAGFLFFDATYGEFAVMFQGGSNSWSEAVKPSPGGTNSQGTGSSASLGFSLLGRYPFAINDKFSWFPMFGVEYHIAVIEKVKVDGRDGKEYSVTNGIRTTDRDKNEKPYPNLMPWNAFWIDIGAGLDYTISGPLYLRAELLFGFRLPTAYEMGALEKAKDIMKISTPTISGLTGSPTLKICAGYRFK